jgi:c-di-GMP-binding flagellar brake protein YcgR
MSSVDKRKHARLESLNLSYVCLDDDNNVVKQGMGRTLNISEAGILLEAYFPIDASYKILLTIGLKDKLVDLKGRLAHSRPTEKGKHEVGIEFIEVDDAARQTLKEFVSSIG